MSYRTAFTDMFWLEKTFKSIESNHQNEKMEGAGAQFSTQEISWDTRSQLLSWAPSVVLHLKHLSSTAPCATETQETCPTKLAVQAAGQSSTTSKHCFLPVYYSSCHLSHCQWSWRRKCPFSLVCPRPEKLSPSPSLHRSPQKALVTSSGLL